MEREEPRRGELPDEIAADRQAVKYLVQEGYIQYPDDYGFDSASDYVSNVVDILDDDPGYPHPVTCEMCEDEEIPQPHLESEMYYEKHQPSDVDYLSPDEVEEFERQGMKVYEVGVEVQCERHGDSDLTSDVSMSYTEYIEAVPGSLDL